MIRQQLYTPPGSLAPASTALFHTLFWCLSSVRSSVLIHAGFLPLCLVFCSSGQTLLELGGGDPWIPASSSQPIFSPGSHSTVFFQAHPWRGFKSALLKSKAVILLFTLLSPPGILNSTFLWTLQPTLPLTFMSLTKFFLVCKCLVQLSTFPCWFLDYLCWKMSSMHSRNLVDCLSTAVLRFQQASGWLKSPMRTRACECEAFSSCLKKASSTSSCSGRQ